MKGRSSTKSAVRWVTTKSMKFQNTAPASLCRTKSLRVWATRGQSGASSRSKHTIRIRRAEKKQQKTKIHQALSLIIFFNRFGGRLLKFTKAPNYRAGISSSVTMFLKFRPKKSGCASGYSNTGNIGNFSDVSCQKPECALYMEAHFKRGKTVRERFLTVLCKSSKNEQNQ